MNRRIFLALSTSLLFIESIFPIVTSARLAEAQAPDVIFKVIYQGDFGTATIVGPSASLSWSDVISCGTAYGTCNQEFDGSASSGVLQVNGTTDTSGSFPSGTGFQSGGVTKYTITIYTKNRPSVTVNVAHSVSTTIATGGEGFASFPFTDDFSYQLDHASGSDSASPSAQYFVNQGCSGANTALTTSFAAYPGVTYTVATGLNGFIDNAGSHVWKSESTNPFDVVTEFSSTFTVTLGSSVPVALIQGPLVSGVPKTYPLREAISFNNLSYDPDNQNGTTALEGICSAQWSMTDPNGVVTNGSGLSSFSYTPTAPGPHTLTLTVTDNEGATSQTQTVFYVDPRDPNPGYCPANTPNYCLSDLGNQLCCGVDPGTGNVHCVYKDPVSTRGLPLYANIHVNSQTRFPTRTTAMGNAAFTYGITVKQLTPAGGSAARWYVIDADGEEHDYGLASGSPTPPAGAFSQLVAVTGGYELQNAGPPEQVERAGNFTYAFDSNGKLTSITDPSANVQELTYDSNGDLVEVEDLSSNRTIQFEYDTPGTIARAVEGGGVTVIHLGYSSGRLTSAAHKNSTGTTIRGVSFTYDSNGLLSGVTKDGDSASAISFSHTLSGNGVYLGNMTWSGGGTSYSYFAAPPSGVTYRVKQTNAQSGQVTYDFNRTGQLLKVTRPAMNGSTVQPTVTYTYDSALNLTSVANGTDTYTFQYDSFGNVVDVTDDQTGHWTYTYSGVDLLTASDTTGTYLTLGYTDSANPHSPTTITDGASRTWTRTYNAYGQITSITPPSGSPQLASSYVYEEDPLETAFGYLKSFTNGAGDDTTFDAYSPLGDLLEVTTSPQSGVTNTTTYTYDAARRMLSMEHPDTKTFEWSYAGRNLESTVDEAGTLREFAWNPATETLASISEPLSRVLSWGYDSNQKLTGFTDALSHATSYTYGNAGELKLATHPDSSAYEYKYDNFGRLKSLTSPRGRVMTYTYDSAGRPTGFTFTSPTQTGQAVGYRADGLVTSTSGSPGSSTISYTSGRQVDTIDSNFGTSGLTAHQYLIHTYNPDGSLATLQWKSGSTTVVTWTYSYDDAGRIDGVSNSFGESSTYIYDGEGKIVTQTNGNGTVTAYGYNQARGWPTTITHSLSGTDFASYAIEYDGGLNTVGNITEVTELDGSVVTYGYDALYRLTSETRTGTNAYTKSYGYDLAGNVTDLDGSTFATYDAANKLATLSGGTFSYDSSGNLTAVAGAGISSSTFTYETRELMETQTQGSTTITYLYDVTGKRVVAKPGTTSSNFRWYIFFGDKLVGEASTSGAKVAYTWGPDGIVSERIIGSNKSLYHHYGPQGETRQLTDSTGAVADSYLYTAYGVPIASSGTDYNPHRYGGKVGYFTDGPVGLLLATHRWYSPNLMRWMTRDPIEYEGGDNLYEYVGDNPGNFVDFDGLQSQELAEAARDLWQNVPRHMPRTPAGGGFAGLGLAAGAGLIIFERCYHEEIHDYLFGPEDDKPYYFDPKEREGDQCKRRKYERPDNPNKRHKRIDPHKNQNRESNIGHPDAEEHNKTNRGRSGYRPTRW